MAAAQGFLNSAKLPTLEKEATLRFLKIWPSYDEGMMCLIQVIIVCYLYD